MLTVEQIGNLLIMCSNLNIINHLERIWRRAFAGWTDEGMRRMGRA